MTQHNARKFSCNEAISGQSFLEQAERPFVLSVIFNKNTEELGIILTIYYWFNQKLFSIEWCIC